MMTAARLDAATVRQAAQGRWAASILPALHIAVPTHPRRHAPCPVCGGHDRFRFDDRDGLGTFFCNQCDPQSGDGFALVMKVRQLPFGEALHLVAGVLGLDPTTPHSPRRPLPPPVVRIDRKARAFQFELGALDLRLRAEKMLQVAKGIDVSALTEAELARVLTQVAKAYADMERADLFEHTADGLMARHHAERTGAR